MENRTMKKPQLMSNPHHQPSNRILAGISLLSPPPPLPFQARIF